MSAALRDMHTSRWREASRRRIQQARGSGGSLACASPCGALHAPRPQVSRRPTSAPWEALSWATPLRRRTPAARARTRAAWQRGSRRGGADGARHAVCSAARTLLARLGLRWRRKCHRGAACGATRRHTRVVGYTVVAAATCLMPTTCCVVFAGRGRRAPLPRRPTAPPLRDARPGRERRRGGRSLRPRCRPHPASLAGPAAARAGPARAAMTRADAPAVAPAAAVAAGGQQQAAGGPAQVSAQPPLYQRLRAGSGCWCPFAA